MILKEIFKRVKGCRLLRCALIASKSEGRLNRIFKKIIKINVFSNKKQSKKNALGVYLFPWQWLKGWWAKILYGIRTLINSDNFLKWESQAIRFHKKHFHMLWMDWSQSFLQNYWSCITKSIIKGMLVSWMS